MSTLTAKIQLRRDTSANWTSNNPILLAGEIAITTDVLYSGTDQPRMKIGNGTDTWLNLDYIPVGGSGGGQDLQSVTDLGSTTTRAINTAGVTSDYFQLDTTATNTNAVGKLVWNDTLGTGEIGLKGGNINAKLAQDLYARVVNKTTQNLLKANYQAVKVQSAQGQRLAVNFAQANTDLNSADTIGIVAENINNNQEGFVITVGQIENLNTTGSLQGETWADGDVLYLSPTTAGSLTNIKPDGSTGHIVVIGYVEYSHQNNGKIYVKIMNGWELDELHNVYINQGTLANNDALIYESSTQLWKNKTIDVKGYALNIRTTTSFNPADSTLYFIGQETQPFTTSSVLPLFIPKTGTIKNILISSRCANGTNENSTFILFLNDISNATLTSTYKFDTLNSFVNYSSAISVNAGDYLYVRWQTPAWVTNPTQIRFNIIFYIE